MHKKRQALIEFNDINSSTDCVNDALRLNVMIAGSPAFLNYSSSSKIIRPGYNWLPVTCLYLVSMINTLTTTTTKKKTKIMLITSEDATKENLVLLITVINPLYPITVDIIYSICSAVIGSGQVLRIVIFRKNGVQAMVEWVDSAKWTIHVNYVFINFFKFEIKDLTVWKQPSLQSSRWMVQIFILDVVH